MQLSMTALTRYVAPPVEELLKATMVIWLIRTHRVGRGDTIASLARGTAGEDGYSLDRFLVINGLTKGAALRPGQIVKIIDE